MRGDASSATHNLADAAIRARRCRDRRFMMERDGDTVCIDAADPAGNQRAARQCRKATTLKNKHDRERAPSGFPAVYPRFGG